MDTAERLLLFTDVARLGNFGRAASERRVDRSVVSKQIARLEEELGARLFHRTTRSLSLTEAGRDVLDEAQRVREALSAARAVAATRTDQLDGILKVASAVHFGRLYVQPATASFAAAHNAISIELRLDDRFVDLVAEGFDLAVRVTAPEDSSLIARRLADNESVLVASPDYLARYGAPSSPEDITQHRCVVYANQTLLVNRWRYRDGEEIKSIDVPATYRVNDGTLVLEAAKAGIGISLVSRFMINREFDDGTLTPLLPGTAFEPYAPIYLVYPARRHLPLKTRAFIDHLVSHIGTPPRWSLQAV